MRSSTSRRSVKQFLRPAVGIFARRVQGSPHRSLCARSGPCLGRGSDVAAEKHGIALIGDTDRPQLGTHSVRCRPCSRASFIRLLQVVRGPGRELTKHDLLGGPSHPSGDRAPPASRSLVTEWRSSSGRVKVTPEGASARDDRHLVDGVRVLAEHAHQRVSSPRGRPSSAAPCRRSSDCGARFPSMHLLLGQLQVLHR